MKILELYSGIGGMHLALKGSTVAEQSEVVLAVELNPVCQEIYRHNFPDTKVLNKNIISLDIADINCLAPDAILMSPPCQPFTRLGKQKDLNDTRNYSFLRFMELLPELKSISYILIENVKGFESSETRQRLLAILKKNNFTVEEYLLNSRQFGICNSRLRYYLLARKSPKVLPDSPSEIITNPPEDYENIIQKMPPVVLPQGISDVLEYCPSNDEWNTYLLSEKQLVKYSSIIDVVTCSSRTSCCFTRNYTRCMEGTGSILSATLNAENPNLKRMEVGGEQENLNYDLKALRLRFFTPKEISRLMMFPNSFTFPEHITLKQRYKTIGNSVNIFVVSLLISYLMKGV